MGFASGAEVIVQAEGSLNKQVEQEDAEKVDSKETSGRFVKSQSSE